MKIFKQLLAAALLTLPLLAGAEQIICKYPDLTIDSKDGSQKFYGKGFYVFFKQAQAQAGKTIAFRASITHVSGPADLGGTFRCSTNPGNQLRFTKSFPMKIAVGKTFEFEAICPVPKLENLYHFNMYLGIRQNGKAHNVWKLSNMRFVVPGAKEVAKAEAVSGVKPARSIGFAALALNKEPLVLVKDGKVRFQIVTADKPDYIAAYAAKELRDHFKMATGSAPAIVKESDFKGGPAIWIGKNKMAAKYKVLPTELALERVLAARVGQNIILSGGDTQGIAYYMVSGRSFVAVGTLYAVYEFLESQLGIRWFWPGKIGTFVPPCKELAVKELFTISQPRYDTRKTFYSIAKDPRVSGAEFEQWYRRNRFGGSIGDPVANHSFNAWVKRYAKTHPEYLALQADGTRKTNGDVGGGHVCMSHPDVLRLTIEEKCEIFRKRPLSSFSPVMPGDSNGLFHCRCAQCQAKIQPEKGPHGLYSDTVWSFVNKAAAGVAARMPGKIITCCAYGDYLRKPSFPLRNNIAVTLCFGNLPRACDSYKTQWLALQKEWGSTGARLYVWEYWNATRYNRGIYGAPAIFPRQLKEIYALDSDSVHGRAIELSDVNTEGKGVRSWADWLYDIQNLYVAGRLLWNPNADIEKELELYYTGFFGPAAAPIREFHNEMEAAWVRAGGEPAKWDFAQCWMKCYPPAFVDRMMGLLQQAVKVSRGKEPYASRTAWLLEAYKGFDRNSRMFRGSKRKTNPIEVKVPKTSDWSKAVVCGNFCDSYNVYEQESKTTMRLRHDGRTLFVKAECSIPMGVGMVKWADKQGTRDALLWDYESIECFFAKGKEIYQFILAPDDKLADFHYNGSKASLKQTMGWNCPGVKFSAKRVGLKWTGELAIPLSALNFADKKGKLRFNLYRNCRYNWPGEPFKWEQSCYLPVYGGFHNVERFGTLTLE